FPTHYARAGAWVAFGGVQTDKTKESIVELTSELLNLAGRRPITPAELTEAKENRVRGYAQEFQSLRQVASQVARLWTHGLPMSELQRYTEEIDRVTLDAVNGRSEERRVGQ